ncbi:MAG TPA: TIGR03435 family protein [Terracidiphilus sp.]|nr:TIGR03435 family protein [Terracidiphilus sp.]
MVSQLLALALTLSSGSLQTQPTPSRPKFRSFEVATIKPVHSDTQRSRYIVMRGTDTFVSKNYTLKLLIAAAYELNPREISGGPTWVDSDHYDILARTPGAVEPNHDEQMRMLRSLLADRFKLSFHRQQKVFSIYELQVGKGGPKLKPSKEAADVPPALISTVYPRHILMPARNATMADFVSILQRAVLDRPVVDKTKLSGRYDFDLQWAPDETQFGGEVPVAPSNAPSPPFFTAIREQLGLRLVATRGPAEALVIDHVERPSPN